VCGAEFEYITLNSKTILLSAKQHCDSKRRECVAIDICASQPCQNGGTCTSYNWYYGSYLCWLFHPTTTALVRMVGLDPLSRCVGSIDLEHCKQDTGVKTFFKYFKISIFILLKLQLKTCVLNVHVCMAGATTPIITTSLVTITSAVVISGATGPTCESSTYSYTRLT
jgi:hypothetical protein